MLASGFLVSLLVSVAYAAVGLPSYIKPCARSDPNFNDCALEHAKQTFPHFVKGDRKYKIPRMDPMEITEMVMSDGPSQSGFTMTMRDVKMYGLKDALIEKTEFDFNKKHIKYETKVPILNIIGKYEISGRLLVLPITGKGDINITLIDNRLTYSYDFDVEERDGTRYHSTKNQKAVVEPSEAHYYLADLFNGDKLLGPQMNDFMNENWKDVYKTLSPAISQAFAQVVGSIVDNIGSVIPYDMAFPEKLP